MPGRIASGRRKTKAITKPTQLSPTQESHSPTDQVTNGKANLDREKAESIELTKMIIHSSASLKSR